MFRLLIALTVGLSLSACSGEPKSERDLDASIDLIKKAGAVDKVVRVTETNDPHDLTGRGDGALAAAVVYDSRLECQSLGVECGAIIEEWPDAEEAKARSEAIKAHQRGMPMLGTEYHFVEDRTLLRVAGDLSREQAAEYERALAG